MDIKALRYFVEVFQQQSFTRAAEQLFVTQPTISKMLQNLEQELDCTLLIRQGRKLLLTDAGRRVYERGVTILSEVRQLNTELTDIHQLNRGTLRLGIPPMVGILMADIIRLFRQRYPGIELKMQEAGGLKVERAVMEGELDLAMTVLPVADPAHFSSCLLFRHRLGVLVPQTAEWDAIESLDPVDLARHPLLIYSEDFVLSRSLAQLFSQTGIQPEISVRSGQWDFIAAMVQARVGIAVLPEPVCRWLNKPSLKWLPLNSRLEWTLGLIWQAQAYLPRSARAWIECCEDYVSQEPAASWAGQ